MKKLVLVFILFILCNYGYSQKKIKKVYLSENDKLIILFKDNTFSFYNYYNNKSDTCFQIEGVYKRKFNHLYLNSYFQVPTDEYSISKTNFKNKDSLYIKVANYFDKFINATIIINDSIAFSNSELLIFSKSEVKKFEITTIDKKIIVPIDMTKNFYEIKIYNFYEYPYRQCFNNTKFRIYNDCIKDVTEFGRGYQRPFIFLQIPSKSFKLPFCNNSL